MAITISKEPLGTVLNAYNNSIIEFSTDVGTPARALIIIDDFTFEITPNNGLFYFNLKEIVKAIINEDNFSDTIAISNPATFVYPDAKLYKEISFDITVIKTNGTSETLNKTYNYFKSTKQIVRKIFTENDLIKILSPSSSIINYVTYFEGLPFDVAIYSNSARIITITNKRTLNSTTVNLVKGVNRLFLSNGENDNLGFENSLPLITGVNELELEVDVSNKLTLFVNKKEVECGVYLKWFNQNGSWSYWKFHPTYSESVKTKELEEINSDFYNNNEIVSRLQQMGKEATKTLTLLSGELDIYEVEVVSQIFTSPKVFYYNNQELQPFQLTDWKGVKINSSNQELRNTKQKLTQYKINIELPEMYTQTYAS